MQSLHYLYVLICVAICAFGVNLAFRLKISKSWRTFLKVDICVLVIYVAWDIWAVHKKNWRFDPSQILGLKVFGGLPIEEILFFIIVPLMTVLTYLALTKLVAGVRKGRAR